MSNFLLFVCAVVLSVASSYAELPFEEIQGSALSIKSEYQQHAAPLYGFVASKTYLPNLRLFGAYGPKRSGILTPEFKTRPQDDYPQDFVASLIQWLFPSFDRSNFVANQLHQDFVGNLTPTILGKVLRENIESNGLADVNTYAEIIDRGLHPEAYDNIIVQFAKKPEVEREGLIRDRITIRMNSRKLRKVKLFSEILVAAFKEAPENPLYPEHVVEQSLLAFFWMKSEKSADKDRLLDALGESIVNSEMRESQQVFSKGIYLDYKDHFEADSQQAVKEIAQDSEIAAFIGHGWWAYENTYPTLIEYASAVYQGKSFPDCFETSLRNLFNILLYNPKTQVFDMDRAEAVLAANRAHFTDELIRYYQQYPTIFSQTSQNARNDWTALVSEVPGVTYRKMRTCEIASSAANLIHLIKHLVESPKFDNEENFEAMSYNLTHILKLFSNKESKWTWAIDEDQIFAKDNNVKINFARNNKEIFAFNIDSFHTLLAYAGKKQNKNWTGQAFKQSKAWQSDCLANLYGGSLKRFKKMSEKPFRERSAMLFSADLYNADLLPEIIEHVLINNVVELYPLFDRWITSLPLQDHQMRYQIYNLFKKHPKGIHSGSDLEKFMNEVQFIESLTTAVKEKDAQKVDCLLRTCHTPDLLMRWDTGGECALGYAVQRNNIGIAKKLILMGNIRGLDLFIENEANYSPLRHAMVAGHLEMTRMLILNGKLTHDDLIKGHCQELMLRMVVNSNSLEMLEMVFNLLDLSRADILAPGVEGDCALHCAAKMGSCSMLDGLIAKGKLSRQDLFVRGEHGKTLLHVAAGRASMINFLIMSYAMTHEEIMLVDSDGRTVLHVAAGASAEVVEALITMGELTHGDVMQQDIVGETALHKAVILGKTEAVEKIITLGRLNHDDIMVADNKGKTVLHKIEVARFHAIKMFEILDKLGQLTREDMLFRNNDGEIALHRYAGGRPDLVQKILKPGLLNRKDFLIKGPKGGNILHLTAKLDKFENFKALVDCLNLSHEDIMATDGKGRTVFHLAVKKESYDFIISVFKYLFESDKLMAEDFTVKDINGRAISDRQPDLLFNNLGADT